MGFQERERGKERRTDEGEAYSFGYASVSAQEKTRLVHEHFDSIAAKYDWMNSLLSLGLHHAWKRKAVAAASLAPGHLVLDGCGGTADLSLLACKTLGEEGRAIVYDMNRAMMQVGQEKVLRSPSAGRVLFVEGDVECMPFPDGTFDAVMVAFGIRNLTHVEDGLIEIHRVLKEQGTFVCLEFSKEITWWFKPLYDVYSFVFMPLAGRILAGSRKAYTYLPESIRVFPTPGELSDVLSGTGFTDVSFTKLTQGIAVVHRATKVRAASAGGQPTTTGRRNP
jgi:demethylmenaquinone methyltransferase / 2-methoxy-6-polyprenyl-1,4-benzoquinol methylase